MMSLIIEKVAEGGFLVLDAAGYRDPGRFSPALFASSTIEEALDFIKNKMTSTCESD